MVDEIKNRWPTWLSVPVIMLFLQMCGMLVVLTIWASGVGTTAGQTAIAIASIDSRLDRVFAALDDIRATLPVVQQRLTTSEAAINDAKGVWASADLRLRAIEQNNAANHADIEQLAHRTGH